MQLYITECLTNLQEVEVEVEVPMVVVVTVVGILVATRRVAMDSTWTVDAPML
jgi:hypothetical protein